jgi:hypothetical protein
VIILKKLLKIILIVTLVGIYILLRESESSLANLGALTLGLVIAVTYAFNINRKKPNLKHPKLDSVFLSLFIPGLGQTVLERKWWKIPLFSILPLIGAILFYAWLYLILPLEVSIIIDWLALNGALILMLGIPILNIIDAYQTGKRYRTGIGKEESLKVE